MLTRRAVLAGLVAAPLAHAGVSRDPSESDSDRLRRRYGSHLRTLRTDHWLVASDASPRYQRVVTELLEAFYTEVHPRFFTGSLDPTDVVIIHGGRDYERFMRARGLDGDGYGSYVDGPPPAIYTRRLFPDGSESGVGTLFHEAVHALVAVDRRRAPAWFNEGFASLFEQGRIVKGRWVYGNPNPWRETPFRADYEKGRVPSLASYLRMPDTVFRGPNSKRNYNTGRSLFLYLLRTDEAALARFVRAVLSGDKGSRALEAATGKELATLEAEWHAHIEAVNFGGDYVYRAKGDLEVLLQGLPAHADYGYLRWCVAEALLRAERAVEAVPHAEAALADPRFCYPHWALESLAHGHWETDPARALACLEEAVTHQPWVERVLEHTWTDLATLADHLGDGPKAEEARETLQRLQAEDAPPA